MGAAVTPQDASSSSPRTADAPDERKPTAGASPSRAIPLPEAAERQVVEELEAQRVKGFRWALTVGAFVAVFTALMDGLVYVRTGQQEHGLFAVLALVALASILLARPLAARGRMDLAVPIPLVIVLLVTPVGPAFTASRGLISLPLAFVVMAVAINFSPRRDLRWYGMGAFVAATATLAFMQVGLYGAGLATSTAAVTNFATATLMSGFIIFVMGHYADRLQSAFDRIIHSNRQLVAAHRDLRTAEASKTRFMNSAAHELNTPLTPIRIQIELLKRRLPADDERAHHAMDVLDRNFVRLRHLVGDILDGSRLNEGQLVMKEVTVDLSGLLDEVVGDYGPAAEHENLRLEHQIAPGVMVRGDPLRLRQVVDNLLSNAMKFTPSGGLINITLGRTDTEAVMAVMDTGLGIDEEGMGQMFQAFSQVHDPREVKASGTGLGLYITKGIVERHGGRIWVKSAGKGQGTTFGVHLPLLDVTPADTQGVTPGQLIPGLGTKFEAREEEPGVAGKRGTGGSSKGPTGTG